MYNHQTTGDSNPRTQQDPEVTLFENFVSEEEVALRDRMKKMPNGFLKSLRKTQQFVPPELEIQHLL